MIIGVLAIAAQGRAQDVNLALGQPVIQSTDGFGFNGSLAVDGIRTGNSISHTNSGDLTPFLEVDLGESIPIENINVATRDNCCTPDQPERDYNILVEVCDASDTILYSSPIFNPWDGTGAGATDLGNGFVFQLDLTGEPGGAVTGQKVRASKTQAFGGSEWLHVAELEVFTGLQNVPRLGLTVNRTTGEISLANRFDTGFTTDYYRISSAADSLDLLVALVGSAARADVTLDRNYLFGDNTGVPAQSENATAGQRIGSGAGGVTFDTGK